MKNPVEDLPPPAGVRFPLDHKIKSRHTANAVLKQAALPKHF